VLLGLAVGDVLTCPDPLKVIAFPGHTNPHAFLVQGCGLCEIADVELNFFISPATSLIAN
jgi:hypothetical protein